MMPLKPTLAGFDGGGSRRMSERGKRRRRPEVVVFFDAEVAAEIAAEARRLNRNRSWVVRRYIRLSLRAIKALPTLTLVGHAPESEAAE
jgi:hypothetical protein